MCIGLIVCPPSNNDPPPALFLEKRYSLLFPPTGSDRQARTVDHMGDCNFQSEVVRETVYITYLLRQRPGCL